MVSSTFVLEKQHVETVKEESMKKAFLRLTTFMAVALFAVGGIAQQDVYSPDYGIGGGGGSGSCSVCHMNGYGLNGSISMSCGSPGPGGLGNQACWIETYPEASYCFVAGDQCCVD
jgi:hypothetical protein